MIDLVNAPQIIPLNIAVLTVSDTRNLTTDDSGNVITQRLAEAGHHLANRSIVIDDIHQIRAIVSNWIASSKVNAVIVTGGTGFTERDNTPQALIPLFDRTVEGFGELFRQVSYESIGTATVQSRAVAGMANRTVVFALPGSPNACRTAWDNILVEQLNSNHKPCNFVSHLAIGVECEINRN